MDKTARYGELIEEILREYSAYKPSYGEVEVETIFLPAQGHYQLMSVGWHGQHRHIGLRRDKRSVALLAIWRNGDETRR